MAVVPLVLVAALSGCTVAGVTTGALIPRYSEVSSDEVRRLPVGETVSVELEGEELQYEMEGELIAMKAGDCSDGVALRDPAWHPRCIPTKEIGAAYHRSGSYALHGFLIGLAVDITLFILITEGIPKDSETVDGPP